MKVKKTHQIFIDTKLDVSQNPSNFNVRLNNWFVRNNILNTDTATNNKWYISVKTFSMINSFSNITKGINDKIVLYTAKLDVSPDLQQDLSNATTDYVKTEIILPEGNPNVIDIRDTLNTALNVPNTEILCKFNNIDCKYEFSAVQTSTYTNKRYILFENTYDLLGFEKDKLYLIDNAANVKFKSSKPVNLLADRLIKFSLGNNSDIRLKNMNYCNHSSLYDECNMFALFPVNVQSYELIYYQRTTEDLIEVELLGNSIRNIEVLARNQDNSIIEGLSNYIMVLDIINIKEYDYQKRIYDVLFEIYMWIGTFLRRYI